LAQGSSVWRAGMSVLSKNAGLFRGLVGAEDLQEPDFNFVFDVEFDLDLDRLTLRREPGQDSPDLALAGPGMSEERWEELRRPSCCSCCSWAAEEEKPAPKDPFAGLSSWSPSRWIFLLFSVGALQAAAEAPFDSACALPF